MKGVARDNNASTECRSNNLDHLVEVRRILYVCVCVEKKKKKEKEKWMDFAGRRNRNKKNDGREIWREKIKKLPGTRWKEFWKEIFRRELDSWALRGEIGSVPLKIIMDTRAPSSMTIYLGEIKGS